MHFICTFLYFLLQKGAATLLEDDRFKKIFEDADFQVDPESEEYRLINPVVSKLDKQKKKKQKAMDANFEEVEVWCLSGYGLAYLSSVTIRVLYGMLE